MWKTPAGIGGPETPIAPTDTIRIVTNDFMYGGGDGYTAFTGGTNVLQPGDDLLQVAIDYVAAHSPVGPVVDGRIVKVALTASPPPSRETGAPRAPVSRFPPIIAA